MPTSDSPYSLHGYPRHRNMLTSASTIQTNASASSRTVGYDAEAAQVKAHTALYERMHPPKMAPSLGRRDVESFQSHVEKDTMERAAVSGGTTESLTSNIHCLIASPTSTVPQEDIPKSGGNDYKIIYKIILILLVLGIVWIPSILYWIKFPKATILGVNNPSWSIWLTVVWAGLWFMTAVSYHTPSIFKSAPTVSSVHRSQHLQEVRAAHRYRGILIWTTVIWFSYQPLIVENVVKAPAEITAILNMIGRLLLGSILCAAFLTIEKVSIQRISEKFHERLYAKRIRDLKKILQALCILHKDAVDVVIRSHARDSELIFESTTHANTDDRKLQFEQLKITTEGEYGRSSPEFPGSAAQGRSPESSIRIALSSPSQSRSLGRRIFYSFSRSGTNYVMAEDIKAFSPTPEDAAIAFAFLDRDGNGNLSRDELEATCLEFHHEQTAIADSMRDMDTALIQLNSIMMSLAYVACAVGMAVVVVAQIAPLIVGVCALVLGLSWVIGASLQEVMTSIIFVFVKHPFDVGDSVIIKNESYLVKEINLLSTVFLDTNSTLVQKSNHQLNNLSIHNSRRSSYLSETFIFEVPYSTTFPEVEGIREKMLEFVKSEKRDFQPVFDVMVKDFAGQSKMILSADIKYKSNVQLKGTRRNKWLCALKSTLAELHIRGPPADSATL